MGSPCPQGLFRKMPGAPRQRLALRRTPTCSLSWTRNVVIKQGADPEGLQRCLMGMRDAAEDWRSVEVEPTAESGGEWRRQRGSPQPASPVGRRVYAPSAAWNLPRGRSLAQGLRWTMYSTGSGSTAGPQL
jgi:hypothetical protein